jgi:hypothetical protein
VICGAGKWVVEESALRLEDLGWPRHYTVADEKIYRTILSHQQTQGSIETS